MQLAFLTAVLGDHPIGDIAAWAAGAGFDALELHVGRHIGDPSQAGEVIDTVRSHGVQVCALTYTTTLLQRDHHAADHARKTAEGVVEAALTHGVEVVCTLAGRDEGATDDENYRIAAEVYTSLADRAAKGNVKVVIENWPGPRNDFVAVTPAGWNRLFQQAPAANLGLNFDPSHLLRLGIDHDAALRDAANRVFFAHAKDTEIFADRLQQVGYHGSGWWTYRLPGHGRIDWRRWLALLREVGFDGALSIEHEDPDWGADGHGSVERREEGLAEGLRALRAAQ